ncbi:hypothetical protein L7F22_045671 [Adiantum nelumboides]|nr:hypothetical protein [Adiantum nelumboides]
MLGARRCLPRLRRILNKLCGPNALVRGSSTAMQTRLIQTQHIEFCHQMQQILATPNAYAFVEILKLCTKWASLEHGNLTYFAVVEESLETNIFVWNTLISFYDKCHCIKDAEHVFAQLSPKNVVTWNAILSSYAKDGQDLVVFLLFARMHLEGLQPDKFTYVSTLKACCNIDSLCRGKVIHTLILEGGFQEDVYVGSALVHMYSVCCSLGTAYTEFEKLPNRNAVTWNAMITGYVKDCQNQIALTTFQRMQHGKVQPNEVTFINVLKAITSIESLLQGMLVHAFIIEGYFELNLMIGTTLIDMYAKCKSLRDAEEVFKRMSKVCVVTWSALLAGYVEHGSNIEALNLFKRMLAYGLALNSVIYLSLLKACAKLAVALFGMLSHALIIETGCEWQEFVRNALLSMHLNLGSSEDAIFVFESVPIRSVVTWSAMIEGYVKLGCGKEALVLFHQMLQHGARPNNVTFLSVLKACSSLHALNEGKLVHIQVTTSGVPADLSVRNTLIDMYAKCASITRALQVFSELPKRSASTWNVIISGYLHHNNGWEALRLFQSMQKEGVVPNIVTFINMLKACWCISAVEEGRLFHIIAMHYTGEMDAILQSALIDFYVKHGCLEDAEKQFDTSSKRDRVPCNAMITGYAQHGLCEEAFGLFLEMLKETIKPDIVTFIALLQACSTTAALVQGKLIHHCIMRSIHSLDVILGNALIDMYSKCGCIVHAQKLFDSLVNRDVISWTALIAGHVIDGEMGMACSASLKCKRRGSSQMKQPLLAFFPGVVIWA